MEPYEIIGAPFTLYIAPAGEAFPEIDADPAGNWKLIGTSGTRNQSEEGVTVSHDQTFDQARPAGAMGPVKAWRMTEDQMVEVTLWDMTVEQYAIAMNDAEITTTAAGVGTAGTKKIGLSRGETVSTYALLVRGPSPYGDAMNAQYEVPYCYQSGSPKPVFQKGKPAALALQFTTLEDPNAASEDERFGRLIAQHQAPLP